jgi:hypothetical protein
MRPEIPMPFPNPIIKVKRQPRSSYNLPSLVFNISIIV